MEEKNKYKPTRMEFTEKGKIEYILSKPDTTKLEKLTNEEIVEYINVNYIDNYDNDKSSLINDLRAFKTYKDDLEIQNINEDIFESFINSLIPIIAIYIATIVGVVEIKNNLDTITKSKDIESITIFYQSVLSYIKNIGHVLLAILVIKIVIFGFRNIGKIKNFKSLLKPSNSRNNKLVSVSYAIHTLESIKEENYHNLDYSEEKKNDKQEVESDEQEIEAVDQETVVPDSNVSETKIISSNTDSLITSSIARDLTIAKDEGKTTLSIQNRHYQLSYSSETVSSGTQTDDLVKYVKKNYFNKDHFDRGKLINDLILFKTMKFDIEMDIKRDENFFTKKQLSNILLSERNDRWSRNNRLKTVNNIILVLEAIKEEIDKKKKD